MESWGRYVSSRFLLIMPAARDGVSLGIVVDNCVRAAFGNAVDWISSMPILMWVNTREPVAVG